MKLSLIIPAYNEEKSLPVLLQSILDKRSVDCPYELIVVNNGSTDGTEKEVLKFKLSNDWIKLVNIFPNRGYGGGIRAAFHMVSKETTHIGWLPSDNQYSFDSVLKMWKVVNNHPMAFHYGWRIKRFDSFISRSISKIYTLLCSIIFFINIKDVNGLPKIFPKHLLHIFEKCSSNNFLFDIETLFKAKKSGLNLIPHKVIFCSRREGVSSWSSKKLKTYFETFLGLLKLRFSASFSLL